LSGLNLSLLHEGRSPDISETIGVTEIGVDAVLNGIGNLDFSCIGSYGIADVVGGAFGYIRSNNQMGQVEAAQAEGRAQP
jgi:hypothetical protein